MAEFGAYSGKSGLGHSLRPGKSYGMRISQTELNQIAGCRYGFMIADMVLGDTLSEFADGSIDEDELSVALQQHRIAYEGYVKRLHEHLRPVAEA